MEDADPFFLDWGSSVNVNEDLRRSIRNEINEIDYDISHLQSNVKAEEKTSHQLTKDFAHARAELMNLSRGATDDRDNSMMNEQIQLRLRDSLLTEVVSVITPPTSPCDKSDDDDVVAVGMDQRESSPIITVIPAHPPQDKSPSSPFDCSNERHLGKYLSKCAAKVKLITSSMKEKKSNLEESESKLSSLQFEIDTLLTQISREQKTQSTWNDDVDEKKKERNVEKQRLRSVKDAIQRARKLNGQYAQRLANDSKLLLVNKARNEEIESKCESKKQAIEKSFQQRKLDYTKLLEKETELINQVESLNRQFKEREDILSKRMAIRKTCEERQSNINNAKRKEEDLLKQLTDLQESHNGKKNRLDQLKKQMKDVEELKVANDLTEGRIVQSSRILYPKLLEEKQSLAKAITELHDQALAEKHEFDKRKQANDIILNKLNAEFAEKLDIVQSKKKEIAEIEASLAESHTSTKNEIEEQENLISNLDEAKQAQKVQNDEVLRQREDVKATYVKWSNQLELKRFEIEVLKRGADIITSTKEEEDELKQSLMNEQQAIKVEATD